jgi:hypothetical protein
MLPYVSIRPIRRRIEYQKLQPSFYMGQPIKNVFIHASEMVHCFNVKVEAIDVSHLHMDYR